MRNILNQDPRKAAQLRAQMQAQMTQIAAPSLTAMPRSPADPHAREARIARTIDALDELRTKYQQAQDFMAWFQPVWDQLSPEEQFVLRRFYMTAQQPQEDNIGDVCEAFHIERTSAYKRKDRAVARLSVLLYGH